MIEELAVIRTVTENSLIVESEVKSSCSSCKQVDACGSGQVAKAIPHRKLTVEINTNDFADNQFNVGESVIIGIPEKNLLSTAMQVYLWPLAGLILFGGFGQFLVQQHYVAHELIALTISVLGGGAGFLIAKIRLNSPKCHQALSPILLKKVSKTISVA